MSKRTLVDAERLSQKIKAYMLENNKKNITITNVGGGFDFVCTPDDGFNLLGEFKDIAQAAVIYIMENDVLRLSFDLKGGKLRAVEVNSPHAAAMEAVAMSKGIPVLPYNVLSVDFIEKLKI